MSYSHTRFLSRLFMFLSICAPMAAVAAEDVVLGASVQLTGPVANTGRYYRDSYQFAIDKINAAGGVKIAGQSHKLALKLYDNQSDVNLSMRQYTQLVTDDKVNLLLGPFASNFALADSAISEKYRIPMVQGGGASDQIFARNFKYIFGTLAPASNYFGSTIGMLKMLKPAPQSVALLYADDAFDVSVADGTRPLLKQAGLNVVMDERYSTNATDFNSLLSQIKSKQADVVLVAGHETEILNFVRQAKSLEVAPKLYSFTVGVPSEDFRKALGKDADYAFGMTPWLPRRSERPLVRRCRAIRQCLQGEVWLRPRLSRRLRRRRRRDAGAGDGGRRHARSAEGARCAGQDQVRQPVRTDRVQRTRADRIAADGDPGAGRQAR